MRVQLKGSFHQLGDQTDQRHKRHPGASPVPTRHFDDFVLHVHLCLVAAVLTNLNSELICQIQHIRQSVQPKLGQFFVSMFAGLGYVGIVIP